MGHLFFILNETNYNTGKKTIQDFRFRVCPACGSIRFMWAKALDIQIKRLSAGIRFLSNRGIPSAPRPAPGEYRSCNKESIGTKCLFPDPSSDGDQSKSGLPGRSKGGPSLSRPGGRLRKSDWTGGSFLRHDIGRSPDPSGSGNPGGHKTGRGRSSVGTGILAIPEGPKRKNFRKQTLRTAKVHERIANMRPDFPHKISTMIEDSQAVVFVAGLSIWTLTRSARGSRDAPGLNLRQRPGGTAFSCLRDGGPSSPTAGTQA
jgi:hypothetical protein